MRISRPDGHGRAGRSRCPPPRIHKSVPLTAIDKEILMLNSFGRWARSLVAEHASHIEALGARRGDPPDQFRGYRAAALEDLPSCEPILLSIPRKLSKRRVEPDVDCQPSRHHDSTGGERDMRTLRQFGNFWILWVATIVLACSSDAVAAQISYEVTDLGAPGNDHTSCAMTLNNRGWIRNGCPGPERRRRLRLRHKKNVSPVSVARLPHGGSPYARRK